MAKSPKSSTETMSNHLYLLTINLNMDSPSGINLTALVGNVKKFLSDQSSGMKCLHKCKVTGEGRVVAVVEVSNVIGLERMVSGLAKLGNVDVKCKPLMIYQKFAEMLKVPDNLTKPPTSTISKDTQLFWLDFTVEYPGKSTDELLATWLKEAKFALEARESGVHIELFKVLGERKVHSFLVMKPEDLDALTFNLPVVKENGNGVTIVCHALQCLDNYVAKMPSGK